MPDSVCPACGALAAAGASTCPVCRAPVLPDEAARLGLDRGRVRWQLTKPPTLDKRWIVAAFAVIGVGSVLGDAIVDSGSPWAALPWMLAVAAIGLALGKNAER